MKLREKDFKNKTYRLDNNESWFTLYFAILYPLQLTQYVPEQVCRTSLNHVFFQVTLAHTNCTAKFDPEDRNRILLEGELICPVPMEMPRINYERFNGKKYRYGYYLHVVILVFERSYVWYKNGTTLPSGATLVVIRRKKCP